MRQARRVRFLCNSFFFEIHLLTSSFFFFWWEIGKVIFYVDVGPPSSSATQIRACDEDHMTEHAVQLYRDRVTDPPADCVVVSLEVMHHCMGFPEDEVSLDD